MSTAVGTQAQIDASFQIGPELKQFWVPSVLYDTEWIETGFDESSRTFFQRPMSQSFVATGVGGSNNQIIPTHKTEIDTNLNQSSMIDYPRAFMAHGYAVLFGRQASDVDIAAIREDGHFEFCRCGGRPYVMCPLTTVPWRGEYSPDFDDAFVGDVVRHMEQMKNMLAEAVLCASAKTKYDMTLLRASAARIDACLGQPIRYRSFGEKPLLLKSGEAFNAKIMFPHGLKDFKGPARIQVVLDGLWYERE